MSTKQQKTALIIGATGMIGNYLLNKLLESPDYSKVIVFTKRTIDLNHPKLEEHIIDFENIQTYQNLIQGDVFFCTIGTTIKKAGSQEAFKKVDYEYPSQFAEIAKANKVNHFIIVSSIGADPKSNNFYLKTKGEIETKLQSLHFDSLSIVRPSLLLGERKEFRFGEKIAIFILPKLSFLLFGSLKKYRPVKAEKVAQAMVSIASKDIKGFNIYESDKIEESLK